MPKEDKYKIFLSPPHQSGDELSYLKKVLESNWLAPGGQFVKSFENELKSRTKRSHCVALNSGTAAIHLALKVIGVDVGDYVLCQSFSFVATANPIAYLGATPVFIDSEKQSWNMDPELLEHAILDLGKSGVRPKAIVYAHIYGNPAQVDKLLEISKKYEIPIVEDAAEAIGSSVNGIPAGCFGDISIFSFNGNKVVTTSGGGALFTDNEKWAARARLLATQARDKQDPFSHFEIGYNYQMSNLSAALGMAQLPKIESWIDKKRKIHKQYCDFFSALGAYQFVDEGKVYFSNRWLSVFMAPSEDMSNQIITSLQKEGIEARRFWKPLHLLNIYPSQNAYVFGVALGLFQKGFCLPSGVGLLSGEQDWIKNIIRRLY